MKDRLQRIREWLKKYERHISTISLVTGFVVDNLTLRRIDLLFENLVFVFYLSVALIAIIVFNFHKIGILRGKILDNLSGFLPIAMQFAFGGLFSGFLIFYSRSASLLNSLPFLLILLGIMVSGELIRDFYKKISYQGTVFFLALFSFITFYLPVITHRMSAGIFILGGIASFLIFGTLALFVSKLAPSMKSDHGKPLFRGVVFIYLIVNIFYFSNVLPPIPLSLKEGDIYHTVTKSGWDYVLEGGERSLLDKFRQYRHIPIPSDSSLYAWSSVFAPTDLNTEIIHEWQYYSGTLDKWVSVGKVSFAITGGRDGGYRGYSKKTNVFPAKWRVDVETPRGQIIGRIKFRVVE